MSARQGVVYLLTGQAHAVRLVVSLWSLRNHYSGPVTVFTTRAESHEIGQRCSQDRRLDVTHLAVSEARVRRNSAFLTKLDLLREPPHEITAYLDADTLVAGPIGELLDLETETQIHATRFAQWVSSGRIMRRRIQRWRTLRQKRFERTWLENLVDEALVTRPAVNGGVFAVRRNAPLIEAWRDLAYAGWRTFICDEIALQLLLHHYPHRLLDCRFNCSPLHARDQKDVRLWHFHGEKHLRHEFARQLWLPAYQECLRENVADMNAWTPAADPQLTQWLSQTQPSV